MTAECPPPWPTPTDARHAHADDIDQQYLAAISFMAGECWTSADKDILPGLSHQDLCSEIYDANEGDDIDYNYDYDYDAYDYDDDGSTWSPDDWEHKTLPPKVCFGLPDEMYSFAPRICSRRVLEALLARLSVIAGVGKSAATGTDVRLYRLPHDPFLETFLHPPTDHRQSTLCQISADLVPGPDSKRNDAMPRLHGKFVLSFRCPPDPSAQGLKLRPLLSPDLEPDTLTLIDLLVMPGTAEIGFRRPPDPTRRDFLDRLDGLLHRILIMIDLPGMAV